MRYLTLFIIGLSLMASALSIGQTITESVDHARTAQLAAMQYE